MAQQKQRKQLILTNDKNIFTYCFQLIQRLQPNFTIDGKELSRDNRNNANNSL